MKRPDRCRTTRLLPLAVVIALTGTIACARHNPETQLFWGELCPDRTPSRSPVVRLATIRDAALRGDSGSLVVRVDSSLSMAPLARTQIVLRSKAIGAMTDTLGRAELVAPAGRYTLVARRIAFERSEVPIEVRRGFRDTLTLGLGSSPACGWASAGDLRRLAPLADVRFARS